MIHVTLTPNGKHLELRNCYEWREQIKAMADPPDVRWNGERRCWLVDARLWDKLAALLGAHFAPLSVDDVLRLPVEGKRVAKKARRTKQQIMADKAADKKQAQAWGKMVVEASHVHSR